VAYLNTGYEAKAMAAVCEAGTAKGPAVPSALRYLEEEVASLGASVDALTARLGPALSNRPRATAINDQAAAGEVCGLENSIAQVRRSVTVIRERVVDTLDCLEI
jgi:hypothetical protein